LIIIAQNDQSYLLVEKADSEIGRVFDLSRKKLFRPFNVASIIARGYWHPFDREARKDEEASILKMAAALDEGDSNA
jgi:hypothetical protein